MTRLNVDMPLVVVGGPPGLGAPTVTIDQFEGARIATRHLLELGHRTVHHVAGPQSWIDATARMRGWSDALRADPAPRGDPGGKLERRQGLRRGRAPRR